MAASLPQYQCHKVVGAMQITATHPGANMLECEDRNITVGPTYFAKHGPTPGGYYVQYEDGYQSFSPAEAFESGYELVVSEENTKRTKKVKKHE